MTKAPKKVLLIGWDAADWKFLTPLIETGQMPNLKKLIEGGVKGKLATLDPPLSPTLWTSIATGKRPYNHGIYGFTEPTPDGKNIRPIYHTNRKVKAIWNILTQHNLKTHVVGWWPSHPAEPINGIMVSNFYHQADRKKKDWSMLKGTVHPSEMSETFAKLRIPPRELTDAHIQPFIQDAIKVDQRVDPRVGMVAKITAECATIHSAATYIMHNHEWDFMAVYFDAIDHYCHGFMKYHPPKQDHIPQEDFEIYKDVVNGGCRFHDMMLGTLMELAGEDTTIMLISDHGFHPDHNRPSIIPKEPSGPAIEHSPYGVIVMKGPDIKKDELLFGASLLDITPTLLALYGLPVAEDMDGKVLTSAFEEGFHFETIQSWENIKGDDGRLPADQEPDQVDVNAELQQLIDLGYVADPGEDKEKAAEETRDENNFYLARSYFDGGKWEEGIKLLEVLYKKRPEVMRYALRLSHGYMMIGIYKRARKVVQHIKKLQKKESPQIDLLEGTLLYSEERYKKALKLFRKVEKEAGGNTLVYMRMSNAYLNLNKLDKAESLIKKVLKLDDENVHAWFSLGLCYYKMVQYESAINAFISAIGLTYYFPQAHFQLGETLFRMEKYEDAAKAYDVCLKIAPGMNMARLRLISIYEQFLNQPGKAFKYKTDFENKIQGEIIIVSGLPRSGTSMMMQMLEAGGIEIFTDKERNADDSNPKGYYEHEAVKSLSKNKKWLPLAKDKAVKVIAQLLFHLPMNFRYKVIFMERSIYEVIESQQKMLNRNGKKINEEVLPLSLVESYKKTLSQIDQWAAKQANVELIKVPYHEVIDNPFLSAMKIHDFLNRDIAPEKMAPVVDSKLYRVRSDKVKQ